MSWWMPFRGPTTPRCGRLSRRPRPWTGQGPRMGRGTSGERLGARATRSAGLPGSGAPTPAGMVLDGGFGPAIGSRWGPGRPQLRVHLELAAWARFMSLVGGEAYPPEPVPSRLRKELGEGRRVAAFLAHLAERKVSASSARVFLAGLRLAATYCQGKVRRHHGTQWCAGRGGSSPGLVGAAG
jgi:hypothetical protein